MGGPQQSEKTSVPSIHTLGAKLSVTWGDVHDDKMSTYVSIHHPDTVGTELAARSDNKISCGVAEALQGKNPYIWQGEPKDRKDAEPSQIRPVANAFYERYRESKGNDICAGLAAAVLLRKTAERAIEKSPSFAGKTSGIVNSSLQVKHAWNSTSETWKVGVPPVGVPNLVIGGNSDNLNENSGSRQFLTNACLLLRDYDNVQISLGKGSAQTGDILRVSGELQQRANRATGEFKSLLLYLGAQIDKRLAAEIKREVEPKAPKR